MLKEIRCGILEMTEIKFLLGGIALKRILVFLLSCITLLTGVGCAVASGAAESNPDYPRKREDVIIRDPCIVVHEGKYYMYGTGVTGKGYGCYISENLEDWSEPVVVFEKPADYDGVYDFWAPECHEYNGKFYLFATYRSALSGKRGVAIYEAEKPDGPFVQLGDGHITPRHRDCIDGTLFVDDDGQPWMVYVNEWTSNPDEVGEMAAAKLSDDLSRFISEPIVLFRADETLWASGKITDGPYLHHTEDGRLIMLWSNGTKKGYAVGIAYSENGKIDGKWKHQPTALYKADNYHKEGGHGMLFTTAEGELLMSVHSPNYSDASVHETAVFLPVKDIGCTVVLDDAGSDAQKAAYFFERLFLKIYYFFADLI